ncbi:MAG: hypothetical protein FWD69_18785 [Polyangiaceae bacterium]|nr:hypothetical protein [Polyangiaceae bacterium]
MRRYLGFVLTAIMSIALVFLIVTRARTTYDAPAKIVPVVSSIDGGADGGVVDAGEVDAGLVDAGALADGSVDAGALAASTIDASAGDATTPPSTAGPLRVTALGWELVAAGAALATANADVATRLPFVLAPETTLEAVSARLARGGGDPAGADVAVLPLPAFVITYDRLRALDLRAFAVVGLSRGREEIHSVQGAWIKPPSGSDEVKLAAFGPSSAGDPAARAAGSESATFLGLFALDLLGVDPSRVRLVAPGSVDGMGAPFAAITKGTADPRRLVLSTSNASRLVPLLLIAPRSKLDADETKLRSFARAWMDGLVRGDAATVARRLAAKDGVPLAEGVTNAPDAVSLVEKLGQIAPATLADQRTWIGPSVHPPSSLATLMQRTWQLARASGLTQGAEPEPLPIDARITTALAMDAAPPAGDALNASVTDAGASAPFAVRTTPLIVYRARGNQIDAAGVAGEIAFLASVFEHATFRVAAKGGEKSARAITAIAQDRFGVSAARLATARGEPKGVFASVDIFDAP